MVEDRSLVPTRRNPAKAKRGYAKGMSPLLLLIGLGLGGYLAVWRNKRALKARKKRRR